MNCTSGGRLQESKMSDNPRKILALFGNIGGVDGGRVSHTHWKQKKRCHMLRIHHTHTYIHTLTCKHVHWLSPNSKSDWASLELSASSAIGSGWRRGKVVAALGEGVTYQMGGLLLGFPLTPRICDSETGTSSAMCCTLHQCALHRVASTTGALNLSTG